MRLPTTITRRCLLSGAALTLILGMAAGLAHLSGRGWVAGGANAAGGASIVTAVTAGQSTDATTTCESVGGTYSTPEASSWECAKVYPSFTDAMMGLKTFNDALLGACVAPDSPDASTNSSGSSAVSVFRCRLA